MADDTGAPPPNLTLDDVAARIRQLATDGERSHFQMGTLYNYVVDNKLAEKSGFHHARDFFKQEVDEVSQAVLSLCGAVARDFTADITATYGISKLGSLMTYEKLTHMPPVQGDPANVPIGVPSKDGDTVEAKPFSQCSLRDLQAALQHLRAPVVPKLPPDDANLVQRIHDQLDGAFSGHSAVKLKAHVHRRETMLSFDNVPVSQLPEILSLLQSALNAPNKPTT